MRSTVYLASSSRIIRRLLLTVQKRHLFWKRVHGVLPSRIWQLTCFVSGSLVQLKVGYWVGTSAFDMQRTGDFGGDI
jgi:hypothetical protein